MEYYNKNIQTSKNVIERILPFLKGKRMLVFGLGYDSELWFHATNGNTFFIEDNETYVNLNPNIPNANIIFHKYTSKVKEGIKLPIHIPDYIKLLGKFDVIFIDGPAGYDKDKPGRVHPFYWSKNVLTQENSLIFVDDCKRKLENECVNYFFKDNIKEFIDSRDGCMKILC